jgi:hypothetical protein
MSNAAQVGIRFPRFPLWQVIRAACISFLVVILYMPLKELRALTEAVIFFSGSNATVAWDPPESGIVDHYVVEMTISDLLGGPQNTITWVDYATTREPRHSLATENGHSYVLRVKAIGPMGEESPYSDERLTLICDSKDPDVAVNPLQTVSGRIRTNNVAMSGTFRDENIANVSVNGQNVDLDIVGGMWRVTLPLAEGLNEITIEARDFAGNVQRQTVEVWHQPIVFNSDPPGAELYIFGTAGYPGIYIAATPFKVCGVLDPSLRIPVSLRKTGSMGLDRAVSVALDQDEVVIPLHPLLMPEQFDVKPLSGLDPTLTASSLVHPFPVDYDLDNTLDVLVGTSTGHVLRLSPAAGQEGMEWQEAAPLIEPGGQMLALDHETIPFLVDVDNDLSFDLVVGGGSDGLTVCRREADGWRVAGSLFPESSIAPPYRDFAFVDWNHDRKKDLLVVDYLGRIEILLNSGSDAAPRFGHESLVLDMPGLMPGAPITTVDWNADSELDIAAQNEQGSLAVWLNAGPSDTTKLLPATTIIDARELGAAVLSPSAVDWNQDGIQDIIVGTDAGQVFMLTGLSRQP